MNENQQGLNLNNQIDDTFKDIFENAPDSSKEKDIIVDVSDDSQNQIIIEDENAPQESVPQIDEEEQRKINIKKKLSSIQRKANRLEDENRRLSEEAMMSHHRAEMLRNQMETSANAAMYHNDEKLKLEQNHLRESFKRANELGDYETVADINIKLSEVAARIENNNQYKLAQAAEIYRMQQMPQMPPMQYQQPQPEYEIDPMQYDWLNKNSWANHQSHDYDPEKVEALADFARTFEGSLARKGQENMINSPYYYQEIDKFLRTEFPRDFPQSSSQLSMNSSRSNVAPVRRASSGSYTPSSSQTRVQLNNEEKEMAKRLGVPLEMYAKHKLNGQRKDQEAFNRSDIGYLQQHGFIK